MDARPIWRAFPALGQGGDDAVGAVAEDRLEAPAEQLAGALGAVNRIGEERIAAGDDRPCRRPVEAALVAMNGHPAQPLHLFPPIGRNAAEEKAPRQRPPTAAR